MLGCLLLWSAMAAAQQPLDLRVVPVKEGVVHSIREVGAPARPAPQGAPPSSVGLTGGVEDTPPVGAVVSRSFGKESSEHKWRFGAAGTPEMQAELARTRFEVVVQMDDGERRTFAVRDISGLRPGQRVSVRSGELQPAGT
jgi:hypothetical protein